jgi:hypothetical protein
MPTLGDIEKAQFGHEGMPPVVHQYLSRLESPQFAWTSQEITISPLDFQQLPDSYVESLNRLEPKYLQLLFVKRLRQFTLQDWSVLPVHQRHKPWRDIQRKFVSRVQTALERQKREKEKGPKEVEESPMSRGDDVQQQQPALRDLLRSYVDDAEWRRLESSDDDDPDAMWEFTDDPEFSRRSMDPPSPPEQSVEEKRRRRR